MRTSLLVAVVTLLAAGCSSDQQHSDAGFGGGTATGGGSATGGGTATGGGSATGGGGGSATGGGGSATGGGGGSATGGGSADAGPGCPHPYGSADRARKLVASHPFPNDGGSSDNRFEVFDVSTSGAVTTTGQFFRMGVATSGQALITFTPDGTIGLVVQDDGTLGVFRFDDGGTAVIVDPGFNGGFYATQILMSSTGQTAWVLDQDTPGNGGGIYQVALGCDGTPTALGKVLAGDNPTAGAWLHTQAATAMIAARGLGPIDGGSAYLVDFSPGSPQVVGVVSAFPDADALVPTLALSEDDAWAVLPDNGIFAGDRIALLAADAGIFSPVQLLTSLGPIGAAFSPFTRRGLVVNTDGHDAYRSLDYSSGAMPWSVASSPLPYVNGAPQLPAAPDLLDRGPLQGTMFIAELDAVRVLRFAADGGIVDVSRTSAGGTDNEQVLGTLGVQP